MKRVFGLIIVISAFASAGASLSSSAYAQSARARRAEPPKEERAQKPESRDEAKDESKGESKDKARDGDGAAAQKADDGEKVLTGKEVTVRAVIKSKPLPGYPREARPFGVAGQVKLRIILGADGEVRDEIEVLEGLPYGVTEEAIKAARQIEFEPAQKDGRPVSQYVTLVYNFNLH
jgi:protein TonB